MQSIWFAWSAVKRRPPARHQQKEKQQPSSREVMQCKVKQHPCYVLGMPPRVGQFRTHLIYINLGQAGILNARKGKGKYFWGNLASSMHGREGIWTIWTS
eukprot:scaffold194686_cov21-Tisochrysis_lutea.AAC.1